MLKFDKIKLNGIDYDIGGSGLTNEAKQALLDSLAKVAWVDENGQDYYDALYSALYPPANLVSISCVYTQSGAVYTTDALDLLRSDLVVTANYDDSSTATVTTYTLSGTLAEGTSTITVSYGGKTATFNVTVTEAPLDTTVRLDTANMNKGQSNTGGSYSNKTGFCPSIKYPITTSLTSGYDYVCGIIPVDEVAANTCKVWFYNQNNEITVATGNGSGRPMQVYSESMTEGSTSFQPTNNLVSLTIPVHVDYLDDSYLYVRSTGDVLFAGRNTPYYGLSNISEANA